MPSGSSPRRDLVVGSPWEVRASDSLIVKKAQKALALLVTFVDLTNFVTLYSNVVHDILVDDREDYPTKVHFGWEATSI